MDSPPPTTSLLGEMLRPATTRLILRWPVLIIMRVIPFLKRRKRNAPPITNISARWVNDGRPVGEDADDNSLANIAASVRFPETPKLKRPVLSLTKRTPIKSVRTSTFSLQLSLAQRLQFHAYEYVAKGVNKELMNKEGIMYTYRNIWLLHDAFIYFLNSG